jgi:hypothetical protein
MIALPSEIFDPFDQLLRSKSLQSNTRFAGTFLPDQLDRKYKNAAKEFIWQWLFPAQSFTLLPEAQEYRRYHIHESVVQKAIKKAVNDAKIVGAD